MLNGGPSATTSSPGVVDVFWKGTDGHLWQMGYRPGHGWTGPFTLGDLYPVS